MVTQTFFSRSFSLLLCASAVFGTAYAEVKDASNEEAIIKCKYHENISLQLPKGCAELLDTPASRSIGQAAVIEAPNTQRMEVFFDLGSSKLQPSSAKELNLIANIINNPVNQGAQYKIIGHTDVTGNWKANMKLSKDRANAVISRLITQYGIPKDKLISEGKGPMQLSNPDNPEGAENRRVNIKLIK